jgi:hypothetical protein
MYACTYRQWRVSVKGGREVEVAIQLRRRRFEAALLLLRRGWGVTVLVGRSSFVVVDCCE